MFDFFSHSLHRISSVFQEGLAQIKWNFINLRVEIHPILTWFQFNPNETKHTTEIHTYISRLTVEWR